MNVGYPIRGFPVPLWSFSTIRTLIVHQYICEKLNVDAQVTKQETEKARGYIDRLNVARSEDRWHDVPELVRKVEKHAPHRICLTVTAKSELKVLSVLGPRQIRPETEIKKSELSQLIPLLLSVLQEEQKYAFDIFKANVCLGWLHWIVGQSSSALERLPVDFSARRATLVEENPDLDDWARVSVVKGAFIRGIAQEDSGDLLGAERTYTSQLPYVFESRPVHSSPQFRKWSNLLLSRLCILSSKDAAAGNVERRGSALRAFRSWSRFRNSLPGKLEPQDTKGDRRVWRLYFKTLSNVFQSGAFVSLRDSELVEQSDEITEKSVTDAKTQLKAELLAVESSYESLLLVEIQFPKAREKNTEAEWWADMVVANWRIIHAYESQVASADKRERQNECHRVLKILYRAASVTFHSTRILRHIFTVYIALADFDLAFKSFDVYVELSLEGQSRNRRSDHTETIEVDDDELYIRTLVEAVCVLCQFGDRHGAEKAREVEKLINDWLKIRLKPHEETAYGPLSGPLPPGQTRGDDSVNIALAYRVLGISRAHWARLTFDAGARSDLQAQALECFKKATKVLPSDLADLDLLYAHSLLLADMREISEAISVVKSALTSSAKHISSPVLPNLSEINGEPSFDRERKMMPLWHLLALLMTARGDYSTASKLCDIAARKISSSFSNLLDGTDSPQHSQPRDSLTPQLNGHKISSLAPIDIMTNDEKQQLLELEITQVALIEMTEGPNAAVDSADSLFSLYARLFGESKIEVMRKRPLEVSETRPGTAHSGIRSVAGSIFGKSRLSHKSRPQSLAAQASRPGTARTSQTAHAPANNLMPVIQVTGENGTPEKVTAGSHRVEAVQNGKSKHRHSSILKRRSGASLRRGRQILGDSEAGESRAAKNATPTALKADDSASLPTALSEITKNDVNAQNTEDYNDEYPSQLSGQTVNGSQVNGSQIRHPDQTIKQQDGGTERLPPLMNILHSPIFTPMQTARQKVSLLIRLWLFVAGLYLRADMPEETRAAIDESHKMLEKFELEVARENSSSGSFAARGWGIGGSVNELWGDVWAERGTLAQAQDMPHLALEYFEQALSYFPDHPAATVGASNILLDMYTKETPLEPVTMDNPSSQSNAASVNHGTTTEHLNGNITPSTPNMHSSPLLSSSPSSSTSKPPPTSPTPEPVTPEYLTRLAARDRAYGLLSSLTKLGTGWDYSEAWMALARAYEESGQIEKAEEALWWVVGLEDSRPVRGWRCVGPGLYVL